MFILRAKTLVQDWFRVRAQFFSAFSLVLICQICPLWPRFFVSWSSSIEPYEVLSAIRSEIEKLLTEVISYELRKRLFTRLKIYSAPSDTFQSPCTIRMQLQVTSLLIVFALGWKRRVDKDRVIIVLWTSDIIYVCWCLKCMKRGKNEKHLRRRYTLYTHIDI